MGRDVSRGTSVLLVARRGPNTASTWMRFVPVSSDCEGLGVGQASWWVLSSREDSNVECTADRQVGVRGAWVRQGRATRVEVVAMLGCALLDMQELTW